GAEHRDGGRGLRRWTQWWLWCRTFPHCRSLARLPSRRPFPPRLSWLWRLCLLRRLWLLAMVPEPLGLCESLGLLIGLVVPTQRPTSKFDNASLHIGAAQRGSGLRSLTKSGPA